MYLPLYETHCLQSSKIDHNFNKETYEAPVTLSYPEWIQFRNQNSLPGSLSSAIVSGGTTKAGAIYQGHVRQNPMTAFLPYDSDDDSTQTENTMETWETFFEKYFHSSWKQLSTTTRWSRDPQNKNLWNLYFTNGQLLAKNISSSLYDWIQSQISQYNDY